jgi:hypothetical protein
MTFNIRKLKDAPTQELLHMWLDYNQDTGIFHWKEEPRRGISLKGKQAGWATPTGYWFIKLGKFADGFGAHRLAWLYVYGEWPSFQVDHVDGNRQNNAIANLRLATPSQQGANSKTKKKIGLKGAFRDKRLKGKPWYSEIKVNGHRISLGRFATEQEAHEAYCAAASEHFGEFARAA